MTESILIALLGAAGSMLIAASGVWVALHRLKAQNFHDESSAAEAVSSATVTLIEPLRGELDRTQKELILTRSQLGVVQKQLDETMIALRSTKNDVLMFQSEIRLLTAQNSALTLRVTELEAENLRLHKQIDLK